MEVPLPVVHSPQSWLRCRFISPWSGRMWVIAVWAISGAGRLTQRLGSTAPIAALLHYKLHPPPSCLPTVVTTNKRNGVSNHPEPWLNLNLWNTRVWAGIHSIWAVNYIPLIYSSQNDNCSPWHNPTTCNPLLQISVIVFTKWDGKKSPFPNKQKTARSWNFSDYLMKMHQFKWASQKC